jgi:hypothetical protein
MVETTQEFMVSRLDRAIELCKETIEHSQDRATADLIKMLEDVRHKVEDHWPLTLQEQEKIIIGAYSLRVFDSPDFNYITNKLVKLDSDLTHDLRKLKENK